MVPRWNYFENFYWQTARNPARNKVSTDQCLTFTSFASVIDIGWMRAGGNSPPRLQMSRPIHAFIPINNAENCLHLYSCNISSLVYIILRLIFLSFYVTLHPGNVISSRINIIKSLFLFWLVFIARGPGWHHSLSALPCARADLIYDLLNK